MKKTNKFSPEVRERAVRMVQEQRGEYALTDPFGYAFAAHVDGLAAGTLD